MGAAWSQQLLWLDGDGGPQDLSGYTARMFVRDKPKGSVLATLTETDGLTLGGAAGTVDILVSAAVTVDVARYRRVRVDVAVKAPGADPVELLFGWVKVSGGPGAWL